MKRTALRQETETKHYVLGHALTVTLTMGAVQQPATQRERRAHLEARHEMFQQLSNLLGVGVAVIDLD
jgi:hypothetical protein